MSTERSVKLAVSAKRGPTCEVSFAQAARILEWALRYGQSLLSANQPLSAEIAARPIDNADGGTGWLVIVESPCWGVIVRIDLRPDGHVRTISHLHVARRISHADVA